MGLVDEQQDRGLRLLHRIDDVLQALFELALDARAGLQQAEVEGAHADGLQAVGDVAFGDTQGQAFDQRGLADTGVADQDGVVLAPPAEDVDDLADFVVAPEHRVDTPVPRLGGYILGVLVEQRLPGAVGSGGGGGQWLDAGLAP
ncbi:hypothetical protein D9M71_215280 [compost metagenome]